MYRNKSHQFPRDYGDGFEERTGSIWLVLFRSNAEPSLLYSAIEFGVKRNLKVFEANLHQMIPSTPAPV
jgi:hypothetical protein